MHSWRSFVVPLLDWDYGASGIRYKFDEPWDGPYNTEYLDAYSKYFSCPAYGSSLRKASYLCVVGSPLWPIPKRIGEDWKNPSSSDNMREGGVLPNSGKALLLAEVVKSDIPWTKPDDISLAEIAKLLREDPSGDRFRRHIRRVVAVDAAKTIFILDPVKDIEEIKTLVESKLAGP